MDENTMDNIEDANDGEPVAESATAAKPEEETTDVAGVDTPGPAPR